MMTRMRQMSKVMFIFVGLAFIALIVFEWGADYSAGGTDNSVGEVNGEKLSYNEFNELYKQVYQNEKARSQGELDDNTLERIRGQVWEQFIQRILFQEQMEKATGTMLDLATWMPEEGRNTIKAWFRTWKEGLEQFKTAIDENVKKTEEVFNTAS